MGRKAWADRHGREREYKETNVSIGEKKDKTTHPERYEGEGTRGQGGASGA